MSKLPIRNLNLCMVGCISSGKSTLINTLFCKELIQTKMKRTLLNPCIFIETDQNNDSIKTEENNNLSSENNYSPLIFNVDKIKINIGPQLVTIFDIPGLNDAKTKLNYYKYLQENFIKFNIILFIIDINYGLTTLDENDILDFIIEQTIINN